MADVFLIPITGPALQNNADFSVGTINVPAPASDSFLTSRGIPSGNDDGDLVVYIRNAQPPLNVDPGDAGG